VLRLGPAAIRFTDRSDGDLGHQGRWVAVDQVDSAVIERRRAVLDRPWSWLRQVHGSRVIVVDEPGGGAGEEGDASVSTVPGAALVVLTADCAPIALSSAEGVIGVVHAGWRGLVAGVVDETVSEMRRLGATEIEAALGPCIHPECYEFSPADLDVVAARLGDKVRGRTSSGAPALDVPAAVRATLARADVTLSHDAAICTACSADHFSHRARGDVGRQATVVWLP
jgi:YfiH family protein